MTPRIGSLFSGHGLKPAACLKMLGNGVVPQQAELALRMLAATDA